MLRVTACCCLLLGALTIGALGQEPAASPKQVLDDWAAAWKTGDVEKLAAFYEPSEQIIAVASSGRSYTGIAQVREMYEDAFAEAKWERVALEGLKLRQDGNTAWGFCRFRAHLTLKSEPARFVLNSQGSFVLRKHEGVWKIALEHFSPIADLQRLEPLSD